MSHRWNCPTDYEARRQARSDVSYDFDYGRGRDDYRRAPYDCDEGNRAYRREYEREAYVREEEAAEERRRLRRREEAAREEAERQAYWAEEQRQRDEEAAYWAAQQEFEWMIWLAAAIYQGAEA